jgi:hypothetical protein
MLVIFRLLSPNQNSVQRSSLVDVDLSRPLLRLLLGDIGFVYPVMSMVVIGPSLPILRLRRWNLLYDVY